MNIINLLACLLSLSLFFLNIYIYKTKTTILKEQFFNDEQTPCIDS